MAEHSRELGRPLHPRVGSQLRPRAASSSLNVAIDSIYSTINSAIGVTMHSSTISDQYQNDKSSVCGSSSSSGIHRSSSSSSSSRRNSGSGSYLSSIDHGIGHDIGGGLGGGLGGGGGGGGGDRGGHTCLTFPPSSSKIGITGIHDNNEAAPMGRSPSSPVASGLERGVLALGKPLQNLGGDEDSSTHLDQYGGKPSIMPFPLSSSGGSEDDELSSDEDDSDEEGGEGGGEEGEEGELDAAVDKIFALFEKGQEALEKILVDRVEQGASFVQDPQQALEKSREEQDVATGHLKMVMGYLIDRLSTAEQEKQGVKEKKNRLRIKLDTEQNQHTLTREALSARVAELVQKLEKAETNQAQITMQLASSIAANERLEETNCGLQAEVTRLTQTLADCTVVTSASADSHIAEAMSVAIDLGSSTPTPSEGNVGPAVIPAGESSSLSAATAAKGKEASSPSAGTPSRPRAEFACVNAPLAVVIPVGKVVASSPAMNDVVEAAAGAADLDIPAATVSKGAVGPVVSPAEGLSFLPADTATKGIAASSLQGVTPLHPRVEVARSSPPFSATFSVGTTASSRSAVTTPSRSIQQAPRKTGKSASGAKVLFKGPGLNSLLVEEGPKKVYGAPRRYTRRPLTPVNLNSGGNRAAGGDQPMFAVRAATKPYTKRSSIGGEVLSLASQGVTKPDPKAYSKRSSTGREAPSLSSRVEAKPDAKAHSKGTTTGREAPSFSSRMEAKPDPKAHSKRSSTGREVPPLSSRVEAKPDLKANSKRSSTAREVPPLSSWLEAKPNSKAHSKRSSTGREVPPLSSQVEAKPALRPHLKRGSTGKEVPSFTARGGSGSAGKSESVGKGSADEVGSGGGARTGSIVKDKAPGEGRKGEIAASGRVLRSASRATAATAAMAAKKEVGVSAASGTMPVDSASTIQPARATRSTTRRLAQQANTTGRGVGSRGKFMSF